MRRSRFLPDLARAVSWHRRKLAVLAAVSAMLVGINAAAPPDPPTGDVVMTRTALATGALLTTADLVVRSVPQSLLPDAAASSLDDLVGRTLVAAVPAQSMLTRFSVLTARSGQPPGTVIAPVELGDAAVVALLRPGDEIDLVSVDSRSGRSEIAVRGARVVTVPQSTDDRSLTAPAATTGNGGLVLVAVTEVEATTLAQSSTDGQLSAILH